MATNNPHESVNHIPFLSAEMEWTLRRLAWRDEIFREALIADPKGIIHYLFHQSLPNGKLPDDLTIKVIEQDPYTRHIVLPAFADEEPTLEIPEEEQLDLIANLGLLDRKRSNDSPESTLSKKSKSTGQNKFDLLKQKSQAEETEKQQQQIKEKKVATEVELAQSLLKAYRQDKEIAQAVNEALLNDGNLKSAMQMMTDKGYLSGLELPKDVNNYKVLKNDQGTYHILLSSSRDEFQNGGIPEKELLKHSNPNHDSDSYQGCHTQPSCETQMYGCSKFCN